MKALGQYAIAATVVTAVIGGAMWPFLDGTGRMSLMVAASIALPVQLGAFLLVVPSLGDQNRFLVRWGIGVLARMGVVGGVGLLLPRLQSLDGGVLLLTICGLFFALLLLEPAFFRIGNKGLARFAP